ncbi:MAG: tRNA guanosine(34) transglycosylase Tgt, partial [Bacteroidetes bacterium]|nr:tRNA guanosine(34) transglycosylase Tgt [Bacteroidota bacterium]
MQFTLEHRDPDTGARAGRIETAHGTIETPIFMPVGTVGSVKAVEPRELVRDVQAQIILGNTYHLYLRPGTDLLERAGGLHPFMDWSGPILTDSGGYQVFSLSDLREISEEGVEFQSHIDGSSHTFTPESVVDIQRAIGSDIMMVLDECPPGDVSEDYARESNERTLRWAKRCQERFAETEGRYGHEQALFAIVQGVTYPEVRRESARRLVDMDFPGYAIGGLSVGEAAAQMYDIVDLCTELLPADKPRYLMGVGTP